MTFTHPAWLWLLVPAVVLAIVEALRRRSLSPGRKAAVIASRLAALAALCLAAAQPEWTVREPDSTVVFLVDRSGSIGDANLAAAWTQATALRQTVAGKAALILFDTDAEVAIEPGQAWSQPASLRPDMTRADPPANPLDAGGRAAGPDHHSWDGTDLAGALRLGLGLIPRGSPGHLVVISDGRATTGALDDATAAAAARGVPISVLATGAVTDDPAIAAIALDGERIRPGATIGGRVELDGAGVRGPAQVDVQVAGKPAASLQVTLTGGPQSVPFTYPLPPEIKPGVITVDARLTLSGPAADRDPGNDAAHAELAIDAKPRILILDGDKDGAAPLAKALEAEQMDVNVVPAYNDGTAPDPGGYDLVVLANAPVRGGVRGGLIDDAYGERLVHWVDQGGGLLVLGGPAALDGNYAANRIADALPVELEPTDPEVDAAATVIIVLDISGSMGVEVGGRTKLALAAEGAAAVVRLLRSFDQVGVEAVEDIVHWTVPVHPIGGSTAALETKIKRIELGGNGIFVYTGLLAAQKAMAKVTTPLRHVILFSDTEDAAEQVKGIEYGYYSSWPNQTNSFDVARDLKASGITLSVIGVGPGRDRAWNPAHYTDDDDDSDFLRELAHQGGGRYYRTTDANQLRALFVQDAQHLLDNDAVDEKIKLHAVSRYPALDGIDLATAPQLDGYEDVKPRPAAQVVLSDELDHPILTRWPYGLGEVAVWSSDAGPRWAKSWLGWPGYERFWTQLVRQSLRRREGDATALELAVDRGHATVRVVQRGDTGGERPAITARVVDGTDTRPLPLRIVEPGVSEATMDVKPDHHPVVEVVDGHGLVLARRTLVAPASAELRQRGPDQAALAALATATGGQVEPKTLTMPHAPGTTRAIPLATWLLLAALALIPLDAALRRPLRLAI
ncbi:MAG TPA: VWA domain-containing protein [Kofleriaceae bacterium]|nr:VWA domain-containing protein [Kofleriaceae bacterium]